MPTTQRNDGKSFYDIVSGIHNIACKLFTYIVIVLYIINKLGIDMNLNNSNMFNIVLNISFNN